MNLTEFLLERVSEEEADARYLVNNGHWRAARDELSLTWDVSTGQTGDTLTVGYVGNRDSEPCARHIARHDPAHVLAECEAKRRIVELHAVSVTGSWVNPPDGPAYQEPERTCAICGWVPDACDTVKALALPYADHPDYRSEWAP